MFFTLEFTEQQARKHIRALEKEPPEVADALDIVTSDEISADYIIRHLAGSERGTVAVIDYLQILDQQRNKPALEEQILPSVILPGNPASYSASSHKLTGRLIQRKNACRIACPTASI